MIVNAGNVGIGTTAPGSKLHVGTTGWSAAQIHFSSGWTTTGTHATIGSGYSGITSSGIMLGHPHVPYWSAYGAKIRFAAVQSPGAYWDLGINAATGGADDRFDLGRSGATAFISVLSAGNVGIGTTGPAAGSKLDVNGKIFEYGKALLPRGVIVMWSGTLANIPAGWALCNGGTYTAPNGDSVTTPDLRDRFIYGTSANEDPGATGGASSYSLTTDQLPSHSHTISADGAHTHDVWVDRQTYGENNDMIFIEKTDKDTITWNDGFISEAGSHSHGGATGSTGSGASIDNRPSYYKLAFIMKL